jgi:tetratricopeptide (TPR) repeat protein
MGDGEYRQALTILNEQFRTPGPWPVSAWALQSTRANCLQMLGRVREAEDMFIQILNDNRFSTSDQASAVSELVAIAAARNDASAELAYRLKAKELGVSLADWNTQRIGELCLLLGHFEQAKASFREVRDAASPTSFRAATIEWGEIVAEYERDFGSEAAVAGRYDGLIHISEAIRPSDEGDRRRLRDLLIAQWSNLLDDASALAWKAREEIHAIGPDEHPTSTTLRLVYSTASSAMLGFCLEENNRPDALEQCYGMHRSAAFVFRSLGDSAFASDAAITCLGIRTDIAPSDERLFGSILYHARDDGPVESDPPGGGCGENINRPSPKPR